MHTILQKCAFFDISLCNIFLLFNIKEKAIPQILSGKNCLLAAETGCGKTLAFLLPIIEQILQWKKEMKPEYNAPFVLIITPSRELTDQIRVRVFSMNFRHFIGYSYLLLLVFSLVIMR